MAFVNASRDYLYALLLDKQEEIARLTLCKSCNSNGWLSFY
ncbi:hypothetical protein [Helicobacter valdiviensis]|nr:hypothetical protein [Helicobacter valdiviensis]